MLIGKHKLDEQRIFQDKFTTSADAAAPTTSADTRLGASRAFLDTQHVTSTGLTAAATAAHLRDHGHGPWGAPGSPGPAQPPPGHHADPDAAAALDPAHPAVEADAHKAKHLAHKAHHEAMKAEAASLINNANALAAATLNLFSGMVLPLAFFPDSLRPWLRAQPIAGLVDIPFSIYFGGLAGWSAAGAVALQLFWVVVLALAGRAWLGWAMRRLQVQGG